THALPTLYPRSTHALPTLCAKNHKGFEVERLDPYDVEDNFGRRWGDHSSGNRASRNSWLAD
ncbi:MAG: hypothetical protein WCJ35_25655, partial [Planctomycetota bacterium]